LVREHLAKVNNSSNLRTASVTTSSKTHPGQDIHGYFGAQMPHPTSAQVLVIGAIPRLWHFGGSPHQNGNGTVQVRSEKEKAPQYPYT